MRIDIRRTLRFLGRSTACLAAAVIVGVPLASAATNAAAPMDITEAIERTLSDNLALKSLRQEAAKAYAKQVGADGLWTPSITVIGAVGTQREPVTSDGTDRDVDTSLRASLVQTLYSGGRNSALRRQALTAKTIADMQLADGENAAVAELFARFYNVILQARKIDTVRSAIAVSEAHLREIERMNELGLSNRLEVIRASGSLATNKAELASAEGGYDAALISLMNFMAIPPSDRREISGELSMIEVSGSREASLATALERRADLRIAEARVKDQYDQVEIERSDMRPSVQMSATAGWLDPYRNADRGSDTWRAELSISIPVLDRSRSRANALNAMAVLEQNKTALAQKDLDVRSDIETAWTEVERMTEQLASTRLALELAEESLRLAEVGFQEGVTPQLDLLTAQRSRTEARLDHISSLYYHTIAVVSLKAAEGTIVEWTREAAR